MALNRGGEAVEGMPDDWIVVPTSRWTSTYLWDEARQAAAENFRRAGALLPVIISADDCIVQEYTDDNKLLFLFVRCIAGTEHFYPYVFTLEPRMTAELRNTGMWGRQH